MTVEIDLERVASVTDRLRRHVTVMGDVADHLTGLGRRTGLVAEVLTVALLAERVARQLGWTASLLARRAEAASRADVAEPGRTSFAGGTALCSAIQVASPIPSRPSTSGVTGAIDQAAVARDALGLADTAVTGTASLAGRSVPVAGLVAAAADVLLCRLSVGSGAAISTRKIVDEDGQEVYESSRSQHKNMYDNAFPLGTDLVSRDRLLWIAEHTNEHGRVTEPYPGYPAYEVNAPRG